MLSEFCKVLSEICLQFKAIYTMRDFTASFIRQALVQMVLMQCYGSIKQILLLRMHVTCFSTTISIRRGYPMYAKWTTSFSPLRALAVPCVPELKALFQPSPSRMRRLNCTARYRILLEACFPELRRDRVKCVAADRFRRIEAHTLARESDYDIPAFTQKEKWFPILSGFRPKTPSGDLL